MKCPTCGAAKRLHMPYLWKIHQEMNDAQRKAWKYAKKLARR